jgi:dynein heavy chain
LYELQPKDAEAAGAGDVKTNVEIANDTLKYILEDMQLRSLIFNLEDIKTKIDADSKGPYQNVFLQEIEYMNILLSEICRSLEEINQGIQGLLTISEKMESIIDALALNKVPVPWTTLAYPSKRGLASWLLNLFQRIDQLNLFRDDPLNIPKVIMISRFFNP